MKNKFTTTHSKWNLIHNLCLCTIIFLSIICISLFSCVKRNPNEIERLIELTRQQQEEIAELNQIIRDYNQMHLDAEADDFDFDIQ